MSGSGFKVRTSRSDFRCRGEGWRLSKTAYDDCGVSGGTMERPALQRMLADINQGLIDITNRVFSDRPGALPRRYAACLCVPEPYPPRHIALERTKISTESFV